MTLWIDAQLPPALAGWIRSTFTVDAFAVRDLGLRDATDMAIFAAAKEADAWIMTKDVDFVRLVEEKGSPPKVIWITCGNTSNDRLKEILLSTLVQAIGLLQRDEQLVEIGTGDSLNNEFEE
jgi:predicted nuclease of predicted toxin-antitoxin system